MTNYHVHIGKYRSRYFHANSVFSAVRQCDGFLGDVDECWFSTTTGCALCMESDAVKGGWPMCRKDVAAKDIYENVRDEMKKALAAADKISRFWQEQNSEGFKAHALYHVMPEIVRSGISIEQAMEEVPYDGLKLHINSRLCEIGDADLEIAKKAFDYAEKHDKRIVILTVICDDNFLQKYEPLIKSHPNCVVQLMHCRNVERLVKNCGNVYFDDSCTYGKLPEKLRQERFLYGFGFPLDRWGEMNDNNFSDEPTEEELKSIFRYDWVFD